MVPSTHAVMLNRLPKSAIGIIAYVFFSPAPSLRLSRRLWADRITPRSPPSPRPPPVALGNPRLSDARAIAHGRLKADAEAHAAAVMPAIREAQPGKSPSLRTGAASRRRERRTGSISICAVVIRVPEAKDAPERPALAFKRPSERGGPAAKQDGAPAIGGAAARGEQNAMADRRDRQAGLKELGNQRLQDIAFEVFPHSTRTMAAGEQQAVEAFDTHPPPGKRGLERRIEPHLGIGRRASAFARAILPNATRRRNPGRKPQRSRPSPVSMMSSALPSRPAGGANTTEGPSRFSTFQLTATSVGSKSLLGIGMSTVAMIHRLHWPEVQDIRSLVGSTARSSSSSPLATGAPSAAN